MDQSSPLLQRRFSRRANIIGGRTVPLTPNYYDQA